MQGPTCPVQRDPPEPGCEDRPYQGELAVTRPDGAAVRRFSTGEDGSFRVPLAPGTYAVRTAAGGLPSCAFVDGTVTVAAGRHTQADVACDTGIR